MKYQWRTYRGYSKCIIHSLGLYTPMLAELHWLSVIVRSRRYSTDHAEHRMYHADIVSKRCCRLVFQSERTVAIRRNKPASVYLRVMTSAGCRQRRDAHACTPASSTDYALTRVDSTQFTRRCWVNEAIDWVGPCCCQSSVRRRRPSILRDAPALAGLDVVRECRHLQVQRVTARFAVQTSIPRAAIYLII